MQLTPRYGDRPIITLDVPPAAIAEPAIRQRRRLASTVAGFTEEQWAAPSRCAGWSNRDVIAHLESTNTFWTFSITQGLRGQPTQFLATFDPVSSPADLVAATAEITAAEINERFATSNDAFLDLLESLDEADWSKVAEAPTGHIAISALTHHALWDSWIHERDILAPLGDTQVEEADEVAASLRYAAALGPAFALSVGRVDFGRLVVVATDPTTELFVEVDDQVHVRSGLPAASDPTDLELVGGSVELLEALSLRTPLPQSTPAATRRVVHSLAEVFEVDAP